MFSDNDYGFFFNNNQLLTRATDEEILLPMTEICNASNVALSQDTYFYLGDLHKKKWHVSHIDLSWAIDNNRYVFRSTRDILAIADAPLCQQIQRAKQLLTWHQSSLFCGHCGSKTQLSTIERSKICEACPCVIYPNTSPAIIVLITHGTKILLGRSPHFPPKIYSNLAGFIDAGENCEMAIHREVAEEVGIKIKNLQYFSSQSWPFPNSFMIGFKAEYASGEICINPNEIEDAQWFEVDELPPLPSKCSIARHMIDDFIASQK